jgi:hypothetical protein
MKQQVSMRQERAQLSSSYPYRKMRNAAGCLNNGWSIDGPMKHLRKLVSKFTPERILRKSSLLIQETVRGVDISRIVYPEEVGLDSRYVGGLYSILEQISCSTPERSPHQQSRHHSGYWLRKRQRHVGHAQIPLCQSGWHRTFQGDQ